MVFVGGSLGLALQEDDKSGLTKVATVDQGGQAAVAGVMMDDTIAKVDSVAANFAEAMVALRTKLAI